MTKSASSARKSTVFSKVTGWIAVGAIALVVLALIVAAVGPGVYNWLTTQNPSSTASMPATDLNKGLNTKDCAWKQDNANYENNRWFAEGIDAIRLATNPAEARDAAQVWVEEVRKDPILLAGAAKIILKQDVDKTTLFKDGCATDTAVQLTFEIETTFALSTFNAINAPSNGFNTGVENGTVVGSPVNGVSGDVKAIQITLPDGSVIWIMARCGNIVTPGPPELPPGCTDECLPPCPPGYDGTVPGVCKDAPSVDAYPSGDAPVAGGPNASSGPGVLKVAPEIVTYVPTLPIVLPAPLVTPIITPSPAPSVNTGGQNNNGSVPTTGETGAPCNKEFQNCP